MPPQAELDEIVAALSEEPLWHASMGSKELFHSNLLAWMVRRFGTQSDVVRQVFAPWLVPSKESDRGRVLREYRHLDLVLQLKGYEPIVIENKTFALPDEAQLHRYSDEVAKHLPGLPQLLLLSLVDPGWDNDQLAIGDRVWRWVSYLALSTQLAAAFLDATEFAGEVLAHEACLMRLLAELMDVVSVRGPGEPFRLPADIPDDSSRSTLRTPSERLEHTRSGS